MNDCCNPQGRPARRAAPTPWLAAAPLVCAVLIAASTLCAASAVAAQARRSAPAQAKRRAPAQNGPPASATIKARLTKAPDSLIVSLLTVGPGAQLFDRFGHAAIRVRNPSTGLDSAWNWGMYDFAAPHFITRFLTGDTQYWMAGFPTFWVTVGAQRAGRAVWEQELALTRVQADTLLRSLRWNAREENRFYRYDYYLDNCSTRVRDALDGVTGGALRRGLVGATGVTWRGETLRLAEAFPVIAFGMTFALGPRADDTLSTWQEAFIPMRLRDAMRQVRVDGPAGPVSLVRGERILEPIGPYVDAASPPQYALTAWVIGFVIALAVVVLGGAAASHSVARQVIRGMGAVWHFTIGVAGLLVLLAGLFTRHRFMAANASVLLGTPVSLLLVVWYVRAWSATAPAHVHRAAIALSGFAVAASMAALGVHFLPALSPRDWAPVALAFPVHAGFAIALIVGGRARRAAAMPRSPDAAGVTT